MISIKALSGLRALIVGLGREGLALANYLNRHGLTVTATDSRSAENFGDKLQFLQKSGVSLALGGHPLNLLDQADILFVSPGVPLEIPFLEEARARKIPLSTETRLFCYLCPALIIGVTGSNGKTTTTTLVGEMIKAGGRRSWVGGNIGRPLIEIVEQIEPDDIVVMELSSFQLEYFHAKLNQAVEVEAIPNVEPAALKALLDNWSPSISAILNITPNHLDRHPSMKHYARAKRAIINYQDKSGRLVMDLDNDMTRTIGKQFGGRTRWFSLEAQIPGGACLIEDDLVLIDFDGTQHRVASKQDIKLRGPHNLSNILAACLLAREAGISLEAMRRVITTFTGVEHRLEFVRELKGARYYDDSIATSPERLIAALRSFGEPMVLLVGGRDKHLPWADAARLMLHKTRAVILFGEAVEIIAKAIEQVRPEIVESDTTVLFCETLDEAVALAVQTAQVGDTVLLSPGCASFDAFSSFAERGEHFKELVRQL